MKKNNFKNYKGVTMISLVIVVTIMLILTGTIIYNASDKISVAKIKQMQSDIQNLRQKINDYYMQYGTIPVKLKYTNNQKIEEINQTGIISEIEKKDEFYIIDLKELENLTLNFGKDYEQITDSMLESEASKYEDIYILNKNSQNIFYVRGIKYGTSKIYSDFSLNEVTDISVDLRYVDGVKIPDGFYYVGGTKSEGIVISDNIADINKGTSHEVAKTLVGNQFVWVPVENDNDFKRYAGYYNNKLQNITGYTEPNLEGYETEELEYNQMKDSVLKYNGFYIARYEMSKDETTNKPASKQGKNVWNNIAWGESTTEIGTQGAVYQSKNMYTQENYGVTSTLVYGVQWDAIMQWIDPNYKKEEGNLTSFVANSERKGNYTGNLLETGSNQDYIIKNIYDLAGNVAEWSMESLNDSRFVRGGYYGDNVDITPVSIRDADGIDESNNVNGFRVALYINIEEKWSKTYDKESVYKDINGDTAYIPQGFQVSQKAGETTINEGLVIRNAITDDRYVWIEVPKSIYTTATSETDYINIEKDMQVYTLAYKEGFESYTDTWYEGCGIENEEKYNELKNNMLTSIFKNGGFYISQYEIGAETYVTSNDDGARTAVSKMNMYPYNYITIEKAQELATNINSVEKTSSLMFGIQWDLVCKFIETKGNKTQEEIKIDSSSWGNFYDSTTRVTNKNSKQYNADKSEEGWTNIIVNTIVKPQTSILLTTGASEENKVLNIYDFAGNTWEIVLENSNIENSNVILRGGYYGKEENSLSVSIRKNILKIESDNNLGFRVTLF